MSRGGLPANTRRSGASIVADGLSQALRVSLDVWNHSLAAGSRRVNTTLKTEEADALLEVLHRGLVHIRLLAQDGDTARVEAIADALHNVPRLLREGQKWGWAVEGFRELFLAALVERYPEFKGFEQPLDEIHR